MSRVKLNRAAMVVWCVDALLFAYIGKIEWAMFATVMGFFHWCVAYGPLREELEKSEKEGE